MSRHTFTPSALARLIALVLAVGAGRASADEQPSYRVAIESALERYRAMDWEGARKAFEQAYAIEPGARTLRGIGLSAYYAHEYLEAANAFERALADERQPLSSEQRAEVRDLLARAYHHVGQVGITTQPEGAEARVDGTPVPADGRLLLSPGHYRIEVVAPGREPHSEEIEVGPGQQLNLHIELAVIPVPAPVADTSLDERPTRPPPARRPVTKPAEHSTGGTDAAVWIAAGATGAFAAAATVFAVLTGDELGDLREACARRGCSTEARTELWRQSPIETYETLTNVALGATALGAGATAALLVLSTGASDDEPALSLGVHRSGLTLRGSF